MKYYSTKRESADVNLQEAVLNSLPPDNGLYMPEYIPTLDPTFINTIESKSNDEIAFTVINALTDSALPEVRLREMVKRAFNFKLPLVSVGKHYVAEQWHGPTLAFKDFGARFMAQLYSYYQEINNQNITVLTATSGDTGGAVAHAFQEVGDVRVIILYPKDRVSDFQEKQIAGCGKQITALEVEGSFDDCQRMVKEAFLDQSLSKKYGLTSANSINLARLIPQVVYYFFAYKNVKDKDKEIVFSVPSGNLGNISAGVLAQRMGCPIKRFILATNINDVAVHYLENKEIKKLDAHPTLSNAMDVGVPSNLVRLVTLHHINHHELQSNITGYRFTDKETIEIIEQIYSEHKYILDPHSAIGYAALSKLSSTEVGIAMSTAHPIKFPKVFKRLGINIDIPASAQKFLDLSIKKRTIPAQLGDLITELNRLQS